jgi:hypothetical protein
LHTTPGQTSSLVRTIHRATSAEAAFILVDCAVPSSLDLICHAFWQVMAAISALSSKVDAGFDQIFGILTDHSRRLDKLQESVQIPRQ